MTKTPRNEALVPAGMGLALLPVAHPHVRPVAAGT